MVKYFQEIQKYNYIKKKNWTKWTLFDIRAPDKMYVGRGLDVYIKKVIMDEVYAEGTAKSNSYS